MSGESIKGILTKFKEDGLIKVKPDSVELLDVEKLNRISQSG